MGKRILIVAHGHPDHQSGGGEIAAHNLHTQLLNIQGVESAFFARHNQRELQHPGVPFSGNGKPGEILFYSTMPDWFRFSQPDKAKVWRDFQSVLETYKPDLVHFHHYLHLGLELFRQVKNNSPQTPIVLTLHEYCAICHNHGQMVTAQDRSLCTEATPQRCHTCFPEYSAQAFFLRERFIKSHFALVDQFISPSQFLADRYISWGLPESRFRVIENMLAESRSQNPLDREQNEPLSASRKARLGFFGQINGFKGVDLLLDALELLPASVQEQIQLDINGSGLSRQPVKLRRKIERAVKRHREIVQLRGPYLQRELDALMAATDWVVVPSIWWENSPVVILEARKNGVPVLCSDIGGMAEKVEPGKTGLHFMARRVESLAEKLTWIVENRDKRAEFARNIRANYNAESSINDHLDVYDRLLNRVKTKIPLKVA